MREAAKKLEGEHDFRHFCKMDVVNVHNFVRTIYSFDIAPAESGYRHTTPPHFTPLPPVAHHSLTFPTGQCRARGGRGLDVHNDHLRPGLFVASSASSLQPTNISQRCSYSRGL